MNIYFDTVKIELKSHEALNIANELKRLKGNHLYNIDVDMEKEFPTLHSLMKMIHDLYQIVK